MTDRPERLAVALEATGKKVFASALDWPGWSRSARTDDAAIEALLAYAPRYAPVATAAGLAWPTSFDVEVVERLEGNAGTEYGVPSRPTRADTRPTDVAAAGRLAAIVEAAWTTFDRIAANAPAELRKGPRGGGRDRDKIVGHVIEADSSYAAQIGIRVKPPRPDDRTTIAGMRNAMLEVLRERSDGSPLADRRWPQRYAARRVAWHSLDHAWEIEDRSE